MTTKATILRASGSCLGKALRRSHPQRGPNATFQVTARAPQLSFGGLFKIYNFWLVTMLLTAGMISLSLVSRPATGAPPTVVPGQNDTQTSLANLIFDACFNRNALLTSQLRKRCNNVVGAGVDKLNSQVLNSTELVSPEQAIEQGTQATKISGAQSAAATAAINTRLTLLRAGISGSSFALNVNGQPATVDGRLNTGGAASADSPGIGGRLSSFLNLRYNWGNVDATFQEQAAFDFNNWGVTAGADYRFTDSFIGGAAFNFFRTDADFERGQGGSARGNTTSNQYGGSIYGSYYGEDRYYIDGLFSFGFHDYSTNRRIAYTISPNTVDTAGDTVNTTATADPNGDHFSVNAGGGYNFYKGAFTLSPYGRVGYTQLNVDSYSEVDPQGWGMRFSDQKAESLTTSIGAQISRAVSTSWGVLVPQIRGDWTHEFLDDGRTILVSLVGDPAPASFNVFTQGPDRDYFNLAADLSAQFARGVSAFVSFDTLLGYSGINSYTAWLGGRIEFE